MAFRRGALSKTRLSRQRQRHADELTFNRHPEVWADGACLLAANNAKKREW